jgi:hypothetical protein
MLPKWHLVGTCPKSVPSKTALPAQVFEGSALEFCLQVYNGAKNYRLELKFAATYGLGVSQSLLGETSVLNIIRPRARNNS